MLEPSKPMAVSELVRTSFDSFLQIHDLRGCDDDDDDDVELHVLGCRLTY